MPAKLSRRHFAFGGACLAASARAGGRREVSIISAPLSLGLRPGARGHEPGTWRAPAMLLAAGLADSVGARRRRALARPRYEFAAQPGTRIRNGHTLRTSLIELASLVEEELGA